MANVPFVLKFRSSNKLSATAWVKLPRSTCKPKNITHWDVVNNDLNDSEISNLQPRDKLANLTDELDAALPPRSK